MSSRGCVREGRHVGIGIACYVEGTGIGPYEGARVTVEPGGKVRVATGVGTQGQGHFTVFAQLVADVLGVDVEDVRVVTGDTREFHWGTGTFASRGAVVAGSACHAAALLVSEKILTLASVLLGRSEGRSWSSAAAACACGDRAIQESALANWRERPTRCAARSRQVPNPASRARHTSARIAAAPPAACTR